MKVLASIETEYVQLTASTYTFRSEVMEVEVLRVLRTRADRTRERYYYSAIIRRPARMHPKARDYERDGVTTINIVRRMNPKWVPPKFPQGKHSVDI